MTKAKNNKTNSKIRICKWNACKNKNSQYVMDRACDSLWLPKNWWCTEDWKVCVEFWWCIWQCARWVNITIERWEWENMTKKIYSNINPLKMWDIVKEFKPKKSKKW